MGEQLKEDFKDIFNEENNDAINSVNETIEVEKAISEENLIKEYDENMKPIEKPNYIQEIVDIVRSDKSPKSTKTKLEDYHGSDIAEALAILSNNERKKIFRILEISLLAEVFEYLDNDEALVYIQEMDIMKASKIISELEPDTAVEILRGIDSVKRTLIIESMESDVKKDIRMIASFADNEIGSKMTTNCIIIKDNLTIKEAMTELVEQAKENDNIQTIFVEDENEEFYGAIDLKELIIARKEDTLESLIVTSFPYVYGYENIDDCIEKLKDYSESLIPVLDNNNKIIGVITSPNLVEVVDDAMSEDFVKFAGLTAEEDLKEGLIQSMKKRLPWLLILLLLGLFVSSAVGAFTDIISSLPIIMAFQSLILDMSGNSGTQSLGVTIRILMDESLTFGQKFKFIFKEMRVGFCNGLIIGFLSTIVVGFYITFVKNKPMEFSFLVSSCIGISMLIAMVISSAVGTIIPMFFKKIKIDPAVASGPLITTINDLIAVITYYSMSWILLINIVKLA